MATSIDAIILAALLEHLEAIDLTPALDIAMPGVSFTPPVYDGNGADYRKGDPKPYLAAWFMPAKTNRVTIDVGPQQKLGVLQVSVMWPANKGQVKPLDVAGAVIDHFNNRFFLVSGVRITVIDEPWLAPPVQSADQLNFPVTINYSAFGPEIAP
ncbi:DUF4128 domain-containing protein [Shinella curvata]|uniref:DUF4128 domain-containing protein n=1 Tax=Shinella curvata TaxID=1817964 RepID=A0ABT8XHI2_9HYPH|nr:phage tail terminator-like protein [Shinella curvata]MCJ8053862.1 DUF4128 domain-containing protein [Shinella curvata]MDO6123194.1 DUF4128 domain-containing protein [Shinella curvata]